jgi:hypothetical protein
LVNDASNLMTDPGNALPPPGDKKAKSLREMAAEAGSDPGKRMMFCPRCRRRWFAVLTSWSIASGQKRQACKCGLCGYIDNATITVVFDNDKDT